MHYHIRTRVLPMIARPSSHCVQSFRSFLKVTFCMLHLRHVPTLCISTICHKLLRRSSCVRTIRTVCKGQVRKRTSVGINEQRISNPYAKSVFTTLGLEKYWMKSASVRILSPCRTKHRLLMDLG